MVSINVGIVRFPNSIPKSGINRKNKVLQDNENQQETDLEKIPNRRLCHSNYTLGPLSKIIRIRWISYQHNGRRITTGKHKYPICPWAAVLTVEVQQTVLRVVNTTQCYISDITSTRSVASTSTWRPFYTRSDRHSHTRTQGTTQMNIEQ